MGRILATPTMAASNSDEVPHMVAAAKSANTPSPCDDRFNGGVEKLEEVMAKLCAVEFGQWHSDDGVRAGRSYGGNGGRLLRLGEHTEGEEGRNGVRGERSTSWWP
jgi:hypothetical protein